jgi:hypothetical protein
MALQRSGEEILAPFFVVLAKFFIEQRSSRRF